MVASYEFKNQMNLNLPHLKDHSQYVRLARALLPNLEPPILMFEEEEGTMFQVIFLHSPLA